MEIAKSILLRLDLFEMVMANIKVPIMIRFFQSKKGYLIASFNSFLNRSNMFIKHN